MADHPPAKEHRSPLLCGGLSLGDHLKRLGVYFFLIPVLGKIPTRHSTDFLQGLGSESRFGYQQTEVFLFRKKLPCILGKTRGNDHLAKNLTDLTGQSQIEGVVYHNDSPKRSLAVGGICMIPGRGQIIRTGHTTGIGMFKNGHRGSLKFTNQIGSGRDIEDVVVGKFFSLQLIKIIEELPVESSLLMRVLPIPQTHRLVGLKIHFCGESGNVIKIRGIRILLGQVFTDRQIIGCGAGENFLGQFPS